MNTINIKKHILFVDDEPNLLAGLKRMLHHMHEQWDMSFVTSGKEALKLMGQQAFDVVVSDMRMPEMEGAELLNHIKKLYPQTICFILSGCTDKKMILKTVGPADRFLTKPCDPGELKEAISKALDARKSLGNKEQLMATLSETRHLPTIPELYTQLKELLESPDSSFKDISAIISKDISMSAKVLQLVNSAFFGLRQRIKNVHQAAVYLGIGTIKAIIITTDVFSKFSEEEMARFSINKLYKHSILTGILSGKIAATLSGQLVDSAGMAGMLHDLGKIIFIKNKPLEYKNIYAKSEKEGIPLHILEKEWMDITHAELGGYLMSKWGLPSEIVEAISFHHAPLQSDKANSAGILTAVHIADSLYHEIDNTSKDENIRLEAVYLKNLKLETYLPDWKEETKIVMEKKDENIEVF